MNFILFVATMLVASHVICNISYYCLWKMGYAKLITGLVFIAMVFVYSNNNMNMYRMIGLMFAGNFAAEVWYKAFTDIIRKKE